MNLFYDTDALEQVAQTAKSANEQIESAAQLLDATTVHDDWTCKERDIINDYIRKNKELASQLRDNARAFYDLIAQIAKEFTDEESRISNMFERLEELLGRIIGGGNSALRDIWNNTDSNSHIEDPWHEAFKENSRRIIERINAAADKRDGIISIDDWNRITEWIRPKPGYIETPQWMIDQGMIIFSSGSNVVSFDDAAITGQSDS